MIELLVLLMSGPLWIVAFVLGCRHFLHMLQLSSYQFQGYFRYLRQSFAKEWLPLLAAGISYFVAFRWFANHGAGALVSNSTPLMQNTEDALRVIWNAALCIFSVVLLIVMIVRFRPKKAKKKFVVTPRVRRLILTLFLLLCVVVLIWYWVVEGKENGMTLFLLFTFLFPLMWVVPTMALPLVVAFANLINLPVEKSINNGYIRDAQRILKEQPDLRIIGVTGSFGKTSVKYYLTTLLSEAYETLMTPESYNTPMGVVRTIREHLKPTTEIFVCEMGARHVHDIKEITDFVLPDDGVLTAIGEQHLETFHTLDNIVATKYELLDAVEEKHPDASRAATGERGMKFVNGDDVNIRAHMKYPEAITYGLNEGNDFRAIDVEASTAGTSFKVQLSERIAKRLQAEQGYDLQEDSRRARASSDETKDAGAAAASGDTTSGKVEICEKGVTFQTSLVGSHNVQNLVGAIAVATMYGIPASKLRKAVRRIEGAPHRLELKRHGNVAILDDAFNSNPTGAAAALDTLAMFQNQVKVLVTPGMVELGEKEAENNEAFGRHAARCADYIILVGEKRTEPIARGILAAGFDPSRLFVKETFDEASVLMYEIDAGKEKVILLENDLPDNY